ncbi:MAG TPA: hypothetical protein VGN17_00385 [Bryobacteraceae bacterium]|jgi:hypothetical protein
MAYLAFADSFQFYDLPTQANQLYNSADFKYGNGNNVLPGSTLLPGSNYGAGQFTLPSEVSELTVGLRWQTPEIFFAPFEFANSASGFGFAIEPVGDGRFTFVAGLAGSRNAGVITTKSIRAWTWYYFELHVSAARHHQPYVPATMTTPAIFEAYSVECFYDFYVNGEAWVSGQFLESPQRRTVGDGNVGDNPWIQHLNVSSVYIHSIPGIMTDFYVTTTGFDPLGDVQVVPLYPTGDHDTQWTPLAGTSHYQQVDTHPPTGSTYNIATSAGLEDSYTLQQLPAFTGEIKGSVAIWYMSLSDPGAGAAFGYYNNDSKATGLFYPSFGSWGFTYDAWRYFPFTSTEWTQAQVNSLALGIARFT